MHAGLYDRETTPFECLSKTPRPSCAPTQREHDGLGTRLARLPQTIMWRLMLQKKRDMPNIYLQLTLGTVQRMMLHIIPDKGKQMMILVVDEQRHSYPIHQQAYTRERNDATIYINNQNSIDPITSSDSFFKGNHIFPRPDVCMTVVSWARNTT